MDQCVHERTLNHSLSKNQALSDSLMAHVSDCPQCTKKYDLLCHENSLLKSKVHGFKISQMTESSLRDEIALILEKSEKDISLSLVKDKFKASGSLRENIYAFYRTLIEPKTILLFALLCSLLLLKL